MAQEPLLICKACGHVNRSMFSFGKGVNVSAFDNRQQCARCGRMLGHPDMSGVSGVSMNYVNRDPNVQLVIANIIDSYVQTGVVEYTQVEYAGLHPLLQQLLDIAKNNPKLRKWAMGIFCFFATNYAVLMQIGHEKNLELRNDIVIQARQFEHDLKLLEESQIKGEGQPGHDSQDASEGLDQSQRQWQLLLNQYRQTAREVSELGAGEGVTEDELRALLDRYHKHLDSLHQLIKEQPGSASLGPVGSQIEPKPSSTSQIHQPEIVVKVGRNQPCPCGSGKKFKRCCGNPAKK